MKSVTEWLGELRAGNRTAMDELVPLLYAEMRGFARRRLSNERAGHTLNTTALVHETYLKLLQNRQLNAEDRNEFLAIAGNTMRRILVDYARTRKREKRGGGKANLPLDEVEELLSDAESDELLLLDEALDRLEAINPEGAEIVKLRYFSGLTLTEIAAELGVSERTLRRKWTAARSWLRKEMDEAADSVP